MNEDLLNQLIKNKAIDKDTELDIETNSLQQTITVTEIKVTGISGYNQTTGKFCIIPYNNSIIKKINGMEIERIAELFHINMDGTANKPPKRRGRKRKIDLN